MKRTLTALAVTPLALMALAGPATAAKPTVTRTSESMSFADVSSDLGMSKFFVFTALSQSGPQLVFQYGKADGMGGAVETMVNTNHGFTLTFGKGSLASATLVADKVPALTCTYQDDVQTGCVSSTVDISLTWTGFGPVSRGGSTSHEISDGFKLISHGSGTSRSATVTGSIAADTTTLNTFDYAELGANKSFEMTHCTGTACPQPEPQRSR